jgi:Fe-S-cluster-containing hydrogenase component 2/CRP-like cAMP-binding protein
MKSASMTCWAVAAKGYDAGIAFDLDRPMGNSSCVSCGECMVSCPTGALTNKSVIGTVLPGGEPVSAEELHALPFFQQVSGTFLDLNRNAVVRRRFRAGDVICREGDYGSTAFYILEGQVDVFLASASAKNDSTTESAGFTELFARVFSPKKKAAAAPDFASHHAVAQLGAGDIFGEMTCMNLYPRSATVRATNDCVMLEMLRNVLDMIRRNKTMRAEIETNYRRRALEDHLRTVPLFSTLSRQFIDELSHSVELVRYSAGEALCRQGKPAAHFFLVRLGFVKQSEAQPGGELVLAYHGHGGCFGETALLCESTCGFTATALDRVEVVKLGTNVFRDMLERFPEIARQLRAAAAPPPSAIRSLSLEKFLGQGLMEANSLLLIDLEKCTRCDHCVKACSDAHGGVTRLVREGLRFDRYLVPTSCRHCREPLCMVGCPVSAIRRRNSPETVIEDWCVGCGLCARNCPYGNITMHDVPGAGVTAQKATTCDLCQDLPEPSCVYACPHDAAKRVDPNVFFRGLTGKDPTG